MVAFNRILFPVDLSGVGERIAPYVRMMAERHQAKLQVLHVLETSPAYNGFIEAQLDLHKLFEDMTQRAKMSLAELVERELSGLGEVQTFVTEGRPSQVIRGFVRENKVELIIMASHARKGLDYAFFGSVAHKIARNSEVPVLLINPALA